MNEPKEPKKEEQSVGKMAKAMAKKLEDELDEKHGPRSLGSKLSEKDLKNAEVAAELGQGLCDVYPRISRNELEEMLRKIVKDSLPQQESGAQQKVVRFLFDAIVVGMMGNAAWDMMKHFIPYLHTFFMSVDTSDFMERSASAYEQVRQAAPPELRDFAASHYRELQAFRIKTWQEIGRQIRSSEFGDTLSDLETRLLLEAVESHLFVPVRS